MEPNVEDLRRHYASLSDEALLDVDRAELTPVAQRCYDEELSKRRIEAEDSDAADDSEGDDPDWLEEAACACSFDSMPGNDAAPDLEEARNILESAGIPNHVNVRQSDPARGAQTHYDLMVPGSLILLATSVLDKELFNPRIESEWRTHLEELSDDDFEALNLDDLIAGLSDRVERLKAAFSDEQARRAN